MIAIVNVSTNDPPVGWQDYEVRINRKVITTFKHKREDGLKVCLEKAAVAVGKQKDLDLVMLMKALEKDY